MVALTDEALGPGWDVGLVLDDGHVGAGDHQAHRPDPEYHQQRVASGQSRGQWVQNAHVPGDTNNMTTMLQSVYKVNGCLDYPPNIIVKAKEAWTILC